MNESEVVISTFVDERGGMQCRSRGGWWAESGRQRAGHKFMEIRGSILIRIINIRLHPMDVTRKEDHVLKLVLQNGIDDHLPFPLESGSVRAAGPTVIARHPQSACLRHRQRDTRDDHFPGCRGS